MARPPAFVEAQRRLARHLRDPVGEPAPPELPEERLAVYRNAVRHNIDRFMGDNYPRVREILPPATWDSMIDDYLRQHVARTPVFARLPDEFIAFLEDWEAPGPAPAYLRELAHFDWLENAVSCDERAVPTSGFDPAGDLLAGPLLFNPVHQLITYRYPVHAIGASYRPQEAPPQTTHLVAFRDAGHSFRVLDLNALASNLFVTLRDDPTSTARTVLLAMAEALAHPEPEAVVEGGLGILQRMHNAGLLLGTRQD